MGRLAQHPGNGTHVRQRIEKLNAERRKLNARMSKLDSELARLKPSTRRKKAPNAAALNQWLDELSDGLGNLPPLPADFSRADLYNDHD
jgi:predicted nuclease with TOPRIM domain